MPCLSSRQRNNAIQALDPRGEQSIAAMKPKVLPPQLHLYLNFVFSCQGLPLQDFPHAANQQKKAGKYVTLLQTLLCIFIISLTLSLFPWI